MKYYGRERICASFIDKNIGKTLNIGAGEIKWIENDLFLGNRNLVSSDIDQKNLGSENLCENKLQFNAEAIPFKNETFSQVIILDVLEHIKNHEKTLDEIYRVLKKKGVLVISVPNDTILSFLNPVRYVQHERHYTIERISNLLREKGFKIERVFAGGKFWELADLYTHFLIKYTSGKIINLEFFNGLRDKEYKKHYRYGNEVIIKARKI